MPEPAAIQSEPVDMTFPDVAVDESPIPRVASESPTPLVETFDPRFERDVEGILYLGRLQRTFTLYGHSFTIQTLLPNETLNVGVVISRYQGSISESLAFVIATVAASVVAVDGHPIPVDPPLGPEDGLAVLRRRFQYLIDHWFHWVCDGIYEEYRRLEGRVEELLGELGKSSGQATKTG